MNKGTKKKKENEKEKTKKYCEQSKIVHETFAQIQKMRFDE